MDASFPIDLVISFACLLLTLLLLTGRKAFSLKSYGWFLFSLNLSWFIFLLVLRLTWNILDYLLINLQPSLRTVIASGFYNVIIIAAVILYVWLLARSFSLNFYGASGTFLISNLCYFIVIFVFFILSGQKLGIEPFIKDYLSDVDKVTTGQNILSFIRFRPFHI